MRSVTLNVIESSFNYTGDVTMSTLMHRTGLILAALLVFQACCILPAAAAPSIQREVVSSNDGTVTITYKIDAEQPFALGIVESVPEGWAFAETDTAVSTAPHFEVDREGGRIAFFVCDVTEVSYTLTGTGDGITGFVTEWVDLCELTPNMNEGKERWNTLGASSVSSVSLQQQAQQPQESPGFGIYAALFGCALGACAIAQRHRTGGDDI
jgi:hypothetical protein